ncbi:RagB/SusD family nutrient uptake outer membrane protein [Echinicola vietnamensis]|uniref:RagB/SusD family protein n=1 Tax=Echinicola vietnamensis (strain DSM 17526 / LMG 23754 / KMM 6221) TaxID=926556 RepID=L0FY18_ECHVK|nr:RagB/SusD family nutrient uptake outer membrane protein [Echinicola vietnamensis]AGA77646.1 RagB/SusD family protein [Echinicola vietnamensis DSM 17526]
MKKRNSIRYYGLRIFLAVEIIFLAGCSELNTWLDEKSTLSDSRPETLTDMRAILDYAEWMNYFCPSMGDLGTDNIYMDIQAFNSAPETQRNAYIWADVIFNEPESLDWTSAYRKIAHANVALDGLNSIKRTSANSAEYDAVKGTALFFRGFTYYGLAQMFCKVYSESNMQSLGLPLRITSDINITPKRSSLEQTYDQIFQDLHEALALLPDVTSYQTRPTKTSVRGLLARVYLNIGDFQNALMYADMALKDNNNLLDFNDSSLVNLSSFYRFPVHPLNPEIMFWAASNLHYVISPLNIMISSVSNDLYQKYDDNDLRKKFFFAEEGENEIKFRGTYSGLNRNFAGIAVNEVILIRAECNARIGNVSDAKEDINLLLEKRYLKGTFEPISIDHPDSLLNKILEERRKELPFTAQLRWDDLRRLNLDERFAKTMKRELGNQVYSLPPNDPRYVFPIPLMDVQLGDLQQNER